jgi:hypothetical protein
LPDATFQQIQDAMADQIRTVIDGEIDGVQVEPRMVVTPASVCVDIYPGTPFYIQIGMGRAEIEVRYTVRARVSTIEHEGAQGLLLDMLDPRSSASIVQALAANKTLNGKVDYVVLEEEGASGFQIFEDAGGQGKYMGCQWNMKVAL